MKKFVKTLRENFIFFLMVLPGAAWLILFFYIPVLGNVVAFKDYHITGEGFIDSVMKSKWVGFDNFKFLFSSKDAYIITRNTVLYNLAFIFLGLIVSVGIAIIFSEMRSKRLVKVFQTSMLFPYFLSWVIISFFTDAFLNVDKGLINHILTSLGMKGINFYTEVAIWPALLLFLGIWKGFGYSSVMYYATIMGIDPTFYEAATVDGASKWQIFKGITFPMLTPNHFFVFMMLTINSFKTFDLIFVLTEGGPGTATTLLSTYIYDQSFSYMRFGMASAASMILFLIVGTITVVMFRMEKKFSDYM